MVREVGFWWVRRGPRWLVAEVEVAYGRSVVWLPGSDRPRGPGDVNEWGPYLGTEASYHQERIDHLERLEEGRANQAKIYLERIARLEEENTNLRAKVEVVEAHLEGFRRGADEAFTAHRDHRARLERERDEAREAFAGVSSDMIMRVGGLRNRYAALVEAAKEVLAIAQGASGQTDETEAATNRLRTALEATLQGET